jgi:hypothetical protein
VTPRLPLLGVLAGVMTVATSVSSAQQTGVEAVSTRRCPVANGIRVSITGIDTTRTARLSLDTQTMLDTTFVLNIAERRWQEPRMTASLEAGIGDTTRARWHACTGVSIAMRDVTLVLRAVHGQIRYKVDLTPLRNVRRLGAPDDPPRR